MGTASTSHTAELTLGQGYCVACAARAFGVVVMLSSGIAIAQTTTDRGDSHSESSSPDVIPYWKDKQKAAGRSACSSLLGIWVLVPLTKMSRNFVISGHEDPT